MALPLTGLALTACTVEAPIAPEPEIAGPVFNTTPTPCSLTIPATTAWEAGALTILNGTAHPAQNIGVSVVNNPINGRVEFRLGGSTGSILGRTNGGGDNGTACHSFAFKSTWNTPPNPGSWDARVPFAFGTHTYTGRKAIWTPQFLNVGIAIVHMGLFATDNGTGDEDPLAGSIKVGNFRAIDGDAKVYGVDRPGKVVLQRFNGTSWVQIGRTNGAGDDGNLMSFTVVNVRTDYDIVGGKVTAQTATPVPVVQIDRGSNVTRLSTHIPGQNIGTLTMLQYTR